MASDTLSSHHGVTLIARPIPVLS